MDTKSKKFKIWEKTAFRITIFFLCGICAAGAAGLALFGAKSLTESELRHNFSVSTSDLFSVREFRESNTLHNSFRNRVFTLNYLFDNFTGKGGVMIADGEVYDRVVYDTVWNLYAQLRDFIEGQTMYMEEYGENETYYGFDEADVQPKGDYTYRVGDVFVWWDPWYEEHQEFDVVKIFENPALMRDGRMKPFDDAGVREAFEATFPEQIKRIRANIAAARQSNTNEPMPPKAVWRYCRKEPHIFH